jgi:hypothetical protein
MIRVCCQAEFLRHAEALERWAEARDRAIAVLDREAGHLADQGRMDRALVFRRVAPAPSGWRGASARRQAARGGRRSPAPCMTDT